jgi:hypothetical protein
VVLKKKVDWRTIKQAKNIMMPKEQDIPTGLHRFPHGGLNLTKGPIGKEEDEDETKESEMDNDSDGTRPHKVKYNSGAQEGSEGVA